MNTSLEPGTELDTLDHELLALLQSEFTFSGDGANESSLMLHASDRNETRTLWDAAATNTAAMKEMLIAATRVLGVDPAPLHNHRMLVVPDYRFGAASRSYKGRAYILLNSGCMNLLSFLTELDILSATLLSKQPADSLTDQLYEWLMGAGVAVACSYLDRPFALPLLRPYMNDEMNAAEVVLLGSAELFVFLHEVAHIELGHIGAGFGDCEARGALPDVQEEYEADRYAIDWLRRGGPHSVAGAVNFLSCLSLLEPVCRTGSRGTGSVRERLLALKHAFGDLVEIPEIPAPADSAGSRGEDAPSDPGLWLRKLKWACAEVAAEIGVQVGEEATSDSARIPPGEEALSAIRAMTATTFAKGSEELDSVIREYFHLPNEWELMRDYIDAHPILLSPAAEDWFKSRIFESRDDKPSRVLLSSQLSLLQRCREVGARNSLPIKDVLFQLLEASSLDSQFEILRAHPHAVSEAGKERAELFYENLLEMNEPDTAGSMQLIAAIISESMEVGIDACLERRRNIPNLPAEVWRLVHQLEAAVRGGDIRRQVEICESALALAAKEEGVPTWSLPFRERLQRLPEF